MKCCSGFGWVSKGKEKLMDVEGLADFVEIGCKLIRI